MYDTYLVLEDIAYEGVADYQFDSLESVQQFLKKKSSSDLDYIKVIKNPEYVSTYDLIK